MVMSSSTQPSLTIGGEITTSIDLKATTASSSIWSRCTTTLYATKEIIRESKKNGFLKKSWPRWSQAMLTPHPPSRKDSTRLLSVTKTNNHQNWVCWRALAFSFCSKIAAVFLSMFQKEERSKRTPLKTAGTHQ